MIVKGAIHFFAEHGFEGGTADLAARLGITQPLLYRYFESKEALIDRVYAEIYPAKWHPDWDQLVVDASRSLRDRLIRFYEAYSVTMLGYEHVRLFIFSGLNGLAFGRDYFDGFEERVVLRLARAVNQQNGRSTRARPSKAIIEAVWSLHAAIFYIGFQRWVYAREAPMDMRSLIELKVDLFLDGISSLKSR
jgi:AcrR family transcriptional regulator